MVGFDSPSHGLRCRRPAVRRVQYRVCQGSFVTDDSGMHTMLVELLVDEPLVVVPDRIAELARRQSPSARLVDGTTGILLSHDEITHAYADGVVAPVQTAILPTEKVRTPNETDLSQTWDFPEAAETLSRVTAQLTVAELLGMAHTAPARIAAFSSVLRAAIEALDPTALWAPHSQQLIRPRTFLENQLAAFVNVRMFNIEGSEGAIVMDTVGLHIFRLPDIQCHFRRLDPSAVANILYNTAAYLVEEGDVIEDGDTISGIRRRETWRCQHEMALIEPERVVLDINTGRRHAVGDR